MNEGRDDLTSVPHLGGKSKFRQKYCNFITDEKDV